MSAYTEVIKIITVTNLKGGSAKTTSVAYLAHAFAEAGNSVLVVDADPQGSALRWSESGEWEIPTLALPVKNLHARLAGIVSPGTDIVLIGTPPLAEQAGIVTSALRAADVVVVTMAPTMLEFERLPDVWDAIEDTEALRAAPAQSVVLLNRTVPNANSTEMYRDLIEGDGRQVLHASIPRREKIAQAFAAPVTEFLAYADAAEEILSLEAMR